MPSFTIFYGIFSLKTSLDDRIRAMIESPYQELETGNIGNKVNT